MRKARDSDEGRQLMEAGMEVWGALMACIVAVWLFVEPAVEGVLSDAAGLVRSRRASAGSVERVGWNVADGAYDVADAVVCVLYGKAVAAGGAVETAAIKGRDTVAWVSRAVTEVDSDKAEVRAAGKQKVVSAVCSPKQSLHAVKDSEEGGKLTSALYKVFLAVLRCCSAVFELLVPVAEGAVSRAATVVDERTKAAAGAEAFALGMMYKTCNVVERGTSSLEQAAKSYEGPASLTLLQLASAVAMFVDWVKEAAVVSRPQVAEPTAVVEPQVVDVKVEEEEEEEPVVAKAEVISTESLLGGPAQMPRAKLQ